MEADKQLEVSGYQRVRDNLASASTRILSPSTAPSVLPPTPVRDGTSYPLTGTMCMSCTPVSLYSVAPALPRVMSTRSELPTTRPSQSSAHGSVSTSDRNRDTRRERPRPACGASDDTL